MKLLTIIAQLLLIVFILHPSLYAQYDAGTVIYNQTSGTNLTSISKNYIVEDFDGDFNADVIMVKYNAVNNTNHLTWYKGNGTGNFSSQNNLLNVNDDHKENEIFYDDMNGDGINDIVFQNDDTVFTTLINDGHGNVIAQINNEVTIDNPFGAMLKEIADIDGDGDIDGIFWNVLEDYYYYPNNGYCLIGYNAGNGFFLDYAYLDNNGLEMFLQVETGDIDGDGDLDVICSGNRLILADVGAHSMFPFVRLYENTGLNNFTEKELELMTTSNYGETTFFSNIKINDINGDGNEELFIEFEIVNLCGTHGEICEGYKQFHVLDYNNQIGEFEILEVYNSWLHSYPVNESLHTYHKIYDDAFHIQFGHQNTDDHLDILSVNVIQGRLQWYLGDGNGGFNNTQIVNFNNQYSNIRPILRVADIDNDTDLDVFVLLNDDTSSTLTVFKNLALSPVCPPVLYLSNNTINSGVYQADITTISAGNVEAGDHVMLKAGTNVRLQSGFRVPVDTRLKVAINPCN